MTGPDGLGYIDTAFLSPEWHIARTEPASKFYSDCESAVWNLCTGCVNERGWLAMENPVGKQCRWMYEASNYDGRPTVDLWESDDGQWFIQCHYRQDAWLEEDKTCEGQTSLFD